MPALEGISNLQQARFREVALLVDSDMPDAVG